MQKIKEELEATKEEKIGEWKLWTKKNDE
jgi:hypothetical protein